MSPEFDSDRYGDILSRETLKDVQMLQTDVAVVKQQVSSLQAAIDKLVTRPEFTPVKVIAYSMAGGALTAIMGALVSLVLHK